jgi:hypothetical protein
MGQGRRVSGGRKRRVNMDNDRQSGRRSGWYDGEIDARRSSDTASECHRYAEELRNAAAAADNEVIRKTLLRFAEEYDRRARYPAENQFPKQRQLWR